jgi:gentisate 1,2-dioxygenase
MESIFVKPELTAERQNFYERTAKKGLSPLWEVLGELLPPEPLRNVVPVLWHYDEIRPYIMEAGKLITAEEAERRVLILENPGLPRSYQITNSLYAGVQLILPGEIAPSHRHAPAALRFVFESDGAYTAVDGERTTMHPGDFILTPAFTYHDHGNETDTPTIWMDGLDLPMVGFFNTCFAQHHPLNRQPITKKEGDANLRFGANMLPIEYQSQGMAAPVFTYPYARSREVLDRLYRNGPLHPCHGVKMQYINPVTGGYPMPTIAAFIQLLPAGFRGALYRSTDSTVYTVVEGEGSTQIGDSSFQWKKHDIFVVPSWYSVCHQASEEAVLFSFSDRAAQKALGFWREETLISD